METNQGGQGKPQIIKDGARSSKSPKIQAAIIEKNRAWIDGKSKDIQSTPDALLSASTSSECIPKTSEITQRTGDLLSTGTSPASVSESTTRQSVPDAVQVYVTSGESKRCYTANMQDHLEVSGDLHGVMTPICAAIAIHVKRVLGPIGLENSREKKEDGAIQLIEALGVNLKSKGNDQDSMSFKNVVHIPRACLQEGQIDALHSSLTTFVRVCCDLNPWSEVHLLQSDLGGMRRAFEQAKEFRSKYGDKDLPKGIVINCNLFKSRIDFGERVGPKPEIDDKEETVPYAGTFGGYSRNEKHANWSHQGKDSKVVKIKIDPDLFYEEVRRLSPLEPIICTILVVETYKEGQLYEIKLKEITSEPGPLVKASVADNELAAK
jgi:hypothetical protein